MSTTCKLVFLSIAGAGCAASPPPVATPTADVSCVRVQTPDQRRDEITLRRIEHDWLAAELRGDARYLECLLVPDYINIRKDGSQRQVGDLLARVRKNAGKQPVIPELSSSVVIHGDVAVVYSSSRLNGDQGEAVDVHFVDSFVFLEGTWHAFAGVDL